MPKQIGANPKARKKRKSKSTVKNQTDRDKQFFFLPITKPIHNKTKDRIPKSAIETQGRRMPRHERIVTHLCTN